MSVRLVVRGGWSTKNVGYPGQIDMSAIKNGTALPKATKGTLFAPT